MRRRRGRVHRGYRPRSRITDLIEENDAMELPSTKWEKAEQAPQFAARILLSRYEAAGRLSITPAEFDKRRIRYGLVAIARVPTSDGPMMSLYRQADVDKLAPGT